MANNVAKNLKKFRKDMRAEKTIEQKEIAQVLSIKCSTYASYENRSDIPIDLLAKLSNYYGIKIDAFFTGKKVSLNCNYSIEEIHNIPLNLRMVRKAKDCTHITIEANLPFSESTVRHYENRTRKLSLDSALILKEFYNCKSIEELLFGERNK